MRWRIYLCFSEGEGGGELGPFGDGEVLLLAELLLERHELLRGEWRPGLPVGFVFPQLAAQLPRRQFRQPVQSAIVETRRKFT